MKDKKNISVERQMDFIKPSKYKIIITILFFVPSILVLFDIPLPNVATIPTYPLKWFLDRVGFKIVVGSVWELIFIDRLTILFYDYILSCLLVSILKKLRLKERLLMRFPEIYKFLRLDIRKVTTTLMFLASLILGFIGVPPFAYFIFAGDAGISQPSFLVTIPLYPLIWISKIINFKLNIRNPNIDLWFAFLLLIVCIYYYILSALLLYFSQKINIKLKHYKRYKSIEIILDFLQPKILKFIILVGLIIYSIFNDFEFFANFLLIIVNRLFQKFINEEWAMILEIFYLYLLSCLIYFIITLLVKTLKVWAKFGTKNKKF